MCGTISRKKLCMNGETSVHGVQYLCSFEQLARIGKLQVVLTDLMVAFGGAGYSARLDIVDVAQQ